MKILSASSPPIMISFNMNIFFYSIAEKYYVSHHMIENEYDIWYKNTYIESSRKNNKSTTNITIIFRISF